MKKMPPIHPGEVLLEEFLQPMEISQYRLAKDTRLAPPRVNEIVHGKRAITANTALRAPNKMIVAPRARVFSSGKEGEAGHPRMVDGA